MNDNVTNELDSRINGIATALVKPLHASSNFHLFRTDYPFPNKVCLTTRMARGFFLIARVTDFRSRLDSLAKFPGGFFRTQLRFNQFVLTDTGAIGIQRPSRPFSV